MCNLVTCIFHFVSDRVKGYLVLMVIKSVMSVMKMLFLKLRMTSKNYFFGFRVKTSLVVVTSGSFH